MKIETRLFVVLMAMGLISMLLTGCSDDDPASPTTGTIHITSPEGLEPPWSLAGPNDYEATGIGTAELGGRPEGDYTITWGDVDGWDTPAEETLDLCCGEPIWFIGDYSLPLIHTSDQLMQHFEFIYSGRLLENYEALLHSDFLFVSQSEDSYGYDTELAIANKMFNEIAGEGGYIIDSIEITQLEPTGVWSPVPSNDENFGEYESVGAQYRPYAIQLRFYIQDQNLIQIVSGHAIFYAITEENGGQTEYRLLGIKDMTFGNKATEAATWTNIKSQFH